MTSIRSKPPRWQKFSFFSFWVIAFIVGILGGLAAVGFRFCVSWLQEVFYQTDELSLQTNAHDISWIWIIILPTLGGLSIGLIYYFCSNKDRNGSVSDVIEGAALRNGRVSRRFGLISTAVSLITLTTGGSTGREGPVVHLGAVISTWVSDLIKVEGISARNLLGCAVAAAVSASFNAPIAGTIFALEVVLRHFAIHAFAPIAIASVVGTIIGRFFYGNATEFSLGIDSVLGFYYELPAFIILGLISGIIAIIFIKSIFFVDDYGSGIQRKYKIPVWLRPAIAGFLLGVIAIKFPHIIGVGYETTAIALIGNFELSTIIVFVVVKIIAVVVTLAGRMGGGIFSPSLMLGALIGLAFGLIATSIFPNVSGSENLYALVGMGAFAAAVLGAPISTTLIIFELTGNWQVGLAVMVAVSSSTALTSKFIDKSFFLSQLSRRNLNLISGPKFFLLRDKKVADLMKFNHLDLLSDQKLDEKIVIKNNNIASTDSLELALNVFEGSSIDYLFVINPNVGEEGLNILGVLYHLDVLKLYNDVLTRSLQEEHS